MTVYYNGKPLTPKMNQSIAEMLDDLGVSQDQCCRIVDWDTSLFCCMRFVEEFSEVSEDAIDFGTAARLGVDILIPSETDSDKGILGHKWVRFTYCPFCGRPLTARMGAMI